MKYRKKPVVIEAEEYKPGMEDGFDKFVLFAYTNVNLTISCAKAGYQGVPYISTLEGRHYISPGDYIITGVKGERYPCKPDVFERTYEPVEEG